MGNSSGDLREFLRNAEALKRQTVQKQQKKKWSNKPLASVEEKRRINNENDTKTRVFGEGVTKR